MSNQKFYFSLIDSLGSPAVLLDTNLVIKGVNTNANHIFADTKSEGLLVGNAFDRLLKDKQFKPELPADLMQQAQQAGAFATTLSTKNAEHSKILLLKFLFLPEGEHGDFGYLCLIKDISDLSDINNATIVLDNILENVPVSIYWKNMEGIYMGCSRYVLDMAGLEDRTQICGLSDFDLPWQERAGTISEIDQHVVISKEVSTIEEEGALDDGRNIYLLSNKVPMFDVGNNIIGMMGISVDITQLKETERGLREAKEAAELANRAKTDFLAMMSHELRTPLNAIMGIVQIIDRERLTSEQIEHLNIIFKSSKGLLSLITDLLDFAKLDSGSLGLLSEPLNIKQVVTDAVEELSPIAQARSLSLDFKPETDLPQDLYGDGRRVRQVIVNLVNNAIKYTNDGGVIVRLSGQGKGGASKPVSVLKLKIRVLVLSLKNSVKYLADSSKCMI